MVSGNMNMAIHTMGVNKMIRSLAWDRARQFRETQTGLLHFRGRIGEGMVVYSNKKSLCLLVTVLKITHKKVKISPK